MSERLAQGQRQAEALELLLAGGEDELEPQHYAELAGAAHQLIAGCAQTLSPLQRAGFGARLEALYHKAGQTAAIAIPGEPVSALALVEARAQQTADMVARLAEVA